MATVIQIKRSANVAAPQTTDLLEGELAYSYDKNNDGTGAKLYIEALDSGDNEVIHAIGGKYYTDAVDGATASNTANKIVKRDANGDFNANVITAHTLVGNIVGTIEGVASSAVIANSANTLTTGRTIELTGDVTGSVSFDGSQNVQISTTIASNSVALGTDTTGDYVQSITGGTGVSVTSGTGEGSTPTIAIGQAVGTTADVTFNTVTADLYGNANTATRLATTRYINLTGDASGTASFDGTGNADISVTIENNSIALGTDTTGDYVGNITAGTGITTTGTPGEGWSVAVGLATSGVSAATYGGATNIPVITVDTYGRITSASNTSISTDLNIAGDSGSDTVSLASEVLSVEGGTGISTTVSGNAITITNDGVTGLSSGGYGISVSAATGSVSVTNTGVTRIAAGTGISVDANNGNVTVTNSGVTQITGTTNEIEVSSGTGSITIGLPDNVTIGQNLTVTGDLIVNGTALTINTATVTVEDPLVKFGNANPADSLDIGFYGTYTSSGEKYAGLFRDASDSGKFKLFVDLDTDPTTNVISTANYTVATLVSNLTGGTVSGLTSAIAVGDGGTGANSFTTNAVLYGQGTSALAEATGSAGQVLQLNGSGVPVFGGIDGGSY